MWGASGCRRSLTRPPRLSRGRRRPQNSYARCLSRAAVDSGPPLSPPTGAVHCRLANSGRETLYSCRTQTRVCCTVARGHESVISTERRKNCVDKAVHQPWRPRTALSRIGLAMNPTPIRGPAECNGLSACDRDDCVIGSPIDLATSTGGLIRGPHGCSRANSQIATPARLRTVAAIAATPIFFVQRATEASRLSC